MEIVLVAAVIAGFILILVRVGFKVKPKPFPPYHKGTEQIETIPYPSGLPGPVKRFYEETVGDMLPVIETAVITGSAVTRFMGLTFNSRFRFIHRAGLEYRHYIEATIFGIPIMKVNEFYLDGSSRLELPFGVIDNDPKVNQAANLGLWAESIWLPSVFLTDPRVRWEPVDEISARLVVPFGESEDSFTVNFDARNGLLTKLEALRWKDAGDEKKTLWRNEAVGWSLFNDIMIPSPGSVRWLNENTPWAVFSIDEVIYNSDVTEYIRQRGL